jgi:hypothetical protein
MPARRRSTWRCNAQATSSQGISRTISHGLDHREVIERLQGIGYCLEYFVIPGVLLGHLCCHIVHRLIFF